MPDTSVPLVCWWSQASCPFLRLHRSGAAPAPRKSLLGALDAERLRRAAADMDAKFEADADAAHAAQLAALTDEERAALGPKA